MLIVALTYFNQSCSIGDEKNIALAVLSDEYLGLILLSM